MSGSPLMQESIWFNKCQVEDAECKYHEHLAKKHEGLAIQDDTTTPPSSSSLVNEIARARETIKYSLDAGVGLKVGVGVDNPELNAQISALEKENIDLKKVTSDIKALVDRLQARVTVLEQTARSGGEKLPLKAPETAASQKQGVDEIDEESDDDDDDDDLFGSDDDEESRKIAEEIKAKSLQEYLDRKSKKKAIIAKSNIILDVKPLGDDTDMEKLIELVKGITLDGLKWGASKLVPVAYGIKKLQITCIVEDDKISTDDLEEGIMAFEDYVQSIDVVAFNKV